ncbi:MAG TPA: SAM-dependent methyltransferase [Streptosporangiaceae bacterium]|nr:SAM-dependent methyltransferase [Streptosporangiaceae bacterium]
MPGYALLILPSSNRVYADQSAALTLAELALFSDGALDSPLGDVAPTTIGGVRYVTFDAAGPLSERDAAVLANLSCGYALFAVRDDGALQPVELRSLDRFDDDLITIQKYQGKTNEQFTKLLINATLLSSAFGRDAFAAFAASPRLALLDPLCGRGTTLNQALRYGWDASGIEIDGKDFDAYSAFVQAYLKRKRLKHHVAAIPIRRDRRVVARRLTVTLAAEKADYKAGDTQQLDVVHADAIKAAEFFKPRSFHLIVTDAPYGVQHGSRTAGNDRDGLARSPLKLLAAALPGWLELLKPGGAIGIAWNTFVARRDAAAQVLADAGLLVCDSGPYLEFAHRVDQAINRDILIARKPG